MGQSAIIMVVTVAIVFALVSINTNQRTNDVSEKALSYYADNVSKNICNSATEMLLTEIADNEEFRIEDLESTEMLNGDVSYTIKDTVISSKDKIKIDVKAIYGGEESKNIIIASVVKEGFIAKPIQAAVTTNNDIKTIGTLVIDGREHDEDGNLIIGGEGTFGVWTTGTLNQSGNSHIGGTDSDGDYAPSRPGNANSIKTSQVWEGGYPSTPDEVLGGEEEGFADGYLMELAKSGDNGSQYVTSPSDLTYPLKGVTYVEISRSWNAANINGSGILIVHNTDLDAIIKTPRGTFKGLVIADDIDKVHGTIIGGLVGLSPNPASGNCVGNGTGEILYSQETIEKASQKTKVDKVSSLPSDTRRIQVDSWIED